MLWLTIGGLMFLILGAIVVKATEKIAVGLILAVIGAILTCVMGGILIRDYDSNSAKCASISGHYGGDSCYVEGVEKDLKEIKL